MGKSTQSGVCHICRSDGELSFEHVPPRSAFNDKPVILRIGRDAIEPNLDNLTPARGRISRKGAGDYTLCPRCNNVTGGWYGSAYAEWAYQGMRLIEHAEKAPSLYHIFRLFPLRVIKQIFCMFFSRNSPNFSEAHEDLVRFVLNKDHKYADRSLRVFVYFNAALLLRHSGITAQINSASGGPNIFSEVAFPPFGYILTVDGKALDDRLAEISFFSRYSYNQWTDVALRLPVFHPCTAFPGDFRSRDEVLADSAAYRKRL
jgi:hypothetical protein